MPPALGRFSTMIVWPRGLPIACAMTRATVSVGPPAAYGTSMVMALVGYCCASALVQNAIDAISDATNEIRFIMGSGGEGAILRKGKVARPAGFEPTTLGYGGQYSDPLSYGRLGRRRIASFSPKITPSQPTRPSGEHARPAFLVHQDAAAADRRRPGFVPRADHRHRVAGAA